MKSKVILTLFFFTLLTVTFAVPVEEGTDVDSEDVIIGLEDDDPSLASEDVTGAGAPPVAVATTNPTTKKKKNACTRLLTRTRYRQFFNGNRPEYYSHLLRALTKAKWCTAEKMAAFLGTVKHETASMSIFFQPIDNGAGILHMIPPNWRFAFNGISDLRRALGSSNQNLINSPTFDQPRFRIMTDPRYMFTVGTWWFKRGAGEILNRGCMTVESDMQNWVKSEQSMTMLKNCVFGFAADPGDWQRRGFIREAYNLLKYRRTASVSSAGVEAAGASVVENDIDVQFDEDETLVFVDAETNKTVSTSVPTMTGNVVPTATATIILAAPHQDGA
ncbi:hypothetical protein BKA69DRAFT_1123842 [Paraphysoderma sedebokerense]|nr:hypothetical protein BKA69DRAFT_1123842 [Paraphysoderma sedebokerense]